jgi:hypothetical protein
MYSRIINPTKISSFQILFILCTEEKYGYKRKSSSLLQFVSICFDNMKIYLTHPWFRTAAKYSVIDICAVLGVIYSVAQKSVILQNVLVLT